MPKGKGDSSTQTVKLPPEIEALATRNLQGAEKAGQIGYVPYQGATMAALNPGQVANMQANTGMANAFGIPTADPTTLLQSLPPVQTFAGGVQGYSPFDLYTQALRKIAPGQAKAIRKFSINPQTGVMPGAATAKANAKAKAKASIGAPAGAPNRAKYYKEGAVRIIDGQQYRFSGGKLRKVGGSRKS
jgi:hypothetical protein